MTLTLLKKMTMKNRQEDAILIDRRKSHSSLLGEGLCFTFHESIPPERKQ